MVSKQHGASTALEVAYQRYRRCKPTKSRKILFLPILRFLLSVNVNNYL